MDWDSDGPIITIAPLDDTRMPEPEAEAAQADPLPGLRRGLILDILV